MFYLLELYNLVDLASVRITTEIRVVSFFLTFEGEKAYLGLYFLLIIGYFFFMGLLNFMF
jgi:hypothetical protein